MRWCFCKAGRVLIAATSFATASLPVVAATIACASTPSVLVLTCACSSFLDSSHNFCRWCSSCSCCQCCSLGFFSSHICSHCCCNFFSSASSCNCCPHACLLSNSPLLPLLKQQSLSFSQLVVILSTLFLFIPSLLPLLLQLLFPFT